MLLSVVIPAFNEEAYLPQTLSRLRWAAEACASGVEVLVVDNASTDRTAAVAREFGAEVVPEAIHNIGRVRNTGAAQSKGDVLVFVDADTLVPENFLQRVADAMAEPDCLGGAADIHHAPASALLRLYLSAWRRVGAALGMAQGAAQFCGSTAFDTLGGYDESQFMGEDVDFYWRLTRLASSRGGHVRFLDDVRVLPSPRRFDRWPLWRTLLWTNPLFIALFRKSRSAWHGWYRRPPG
jgi:glycosyltransferase involved in cell wall biosynthesis